MFDLSWGELLLCAALALIVVGPQDMPKLFRAAGHLIARARRMYSDVVGSMHQLEKEVDMAGGRQSRAANWRSLVPEDIRNLPEDFLPGSLTPEQHRQHREALDQARRQAERNETEGQSTTTKRSRQP